MEKPNTMKRIFKFKKERPRQDIIIHPVGAKLPQQRQGGFWRVDNFSRPRALKAWKLEKFAKSYVLSKMDVYAIQPQLIYTTYYLGFPLAYTTYCCGIGFGEVVREKSIQIYLFRKRPNKLPRWHVAFRQNTF